MADVITTSKKRALFDISLHGEQQYLDAITNEENRYVVPNHVEVALPCVKFDGKTSWVPESLRAASFMNHSGEAYD